MRGAGDAARMRAAAGLCALLLVGCATQGPHNAGVSDAPERRYTGVVEEVQATTRAGGFTSDSTRVALFPLMFFGAIGGAIYGAATSDSVSEEPTQMQVVKLDSGHKVTLISDETRAPGDCVTLVVNEVSAEPLPWYSYGQARLEPMNCAR